MKYTLCIALILTLSGCTECDFSIPKNYKSFLFKYNVGDTIFFESNLGDLDTIVVVNYDTMEICGQGFMAGPRKHYKYEIHHLPKNKWIGGTEHIRGKKMTLLNQDLVILEKSFDPNDPNEFFTYVNYREFGGELFDINQTITDLTFKDIGVSEYWKIKKSNNYNQKEIPDSIIHYVFWSVKYGLTGYEYGNGEMYKIKK
jgi:hypothetical protein